MSRRTTVTVLALGTAQTLAWASSFYLPAILAPAMARDLGVPVPSVFAAVSLALGVSALVGAQAGTAIDRHGGRPVLMLTNLVFAAGLAALASVTGPAGLFAAWIVLGVAMGAGLYEAAFAALVRLHGRDARTAITGVTLVAGFASTVGWPLMAWLEARHGWRGACLAWAALHLAVGLPLNALVPRVSARGADPDARDADPAAAAATAAGTTRATAPHGLARASAPSATRTVLLLSFAFAATGFVSTAMAQHLPAAMGAVGVPVATAVAVGALIGPSQVAARLLEFGLLRRVHPLRPARIAQAMHPLAIAVLVVAGPAAAPLFVVLHGAGNGLLTITKGTLPLALFGPAGYGHRQGLLMVPARLTQAVSPWLFGLALDAWGSGALALSAVVGGAATVALMGLPDRSARPGTAT